MDLFAAREPLRQRHSLGYVVAVVLALLALGIRFAIGSLLAGYPFLTFFPAVLLAAFLGGRGPGMVCAILSGLLAWYWLIEPVDSFSLEWPDGAIALGFYAFIAGTIVLLISAMNRAYERLKLSEADYAGLNAELERRVEDRTRELTVANERLRAEIAARVDAEERATQLQKLEAVGQLTGGIAHDFNNMLGIVVGNLDLARNRLARGSTDIVRYIDGAMDGAQRAAGLTSRLLAFARKQTLRPAVIDVNSLVSGMSELLRRTLGERVEVECVLAGGLWRTCIDPGQLEAAIVNLCINSRDAMPDGGKLTIETLNTHLDEAYAAENADVTPGQYVCVAVSDTGSGMTADVLAQVFEPFFTTKPVGQGTGLGLSQIYGYLKQSEGHAKIYSEVGHGTTVKLYFPRYRGGQGVSDAAGEPEPQSIRPPARSGEVILVVEDDSGVRATSVEALRELGYAVHHAADGTAALDFLKAENRVDLLFTDVVMPGMTGRELADEAARRRPGLKILFTTGYTQNAIVHGGRLDEGVELLPKPFSLDQLARKIRNLLDGEGSG